MKKSFYNIVSAFVLTGVACVHADNQNVDMTLKTGVLKDSVNSLNLHVQEEILKDNGIASDKKEEAISALQQLLIKEENVQKFIDDESLSAKKKNKLLKFAKKHLDAAVSALNKKEDHNQISVSADAAGSEEDAGQLEN